MDQNELIDQLKRWGLVKTFVPGEATEAVPNRRQHIIERTRKFAPLTRKRAARVLVKRDGTDRRTIVAKAAKVKGMGIVPMWSNDPIRCTETRGGRPTDLNQTLHMPTELQWVDRAIDALAKKSPVLGLIVREEFTGFGVTQKDRAIAAQRKYGGNLTYWQYRRDLERALSFLDGFREAA